MSNSTPGKTRILPIVRESGSFNVVFGVVTERDRQMFGPTVDGRILGPDENAYFGGLKFERRRQSYFLGRSAAKIALQKVIDEPDLRKLQIVPGVFGQPLVEYSGSAMPGISISHCPGLAVALTFPRGHPMGIDVEQTIPDRDGVIKTQLSQRELAWTTAAVEGAAELRMLLWTAKEALSKTLTTGLMSPMDIYEVSEMHSAGRMVWEGLFQKFAQYKFIGWLCPGYAMAIVLPKFSILNPESIQMTELVL